MTRTRSLISCLIFHGMMRSMKKNIFEGVWRLPYQKYHIYTWLQQHRPKPVLSGRGSRETKRRKCQSKTKGRTGNIFCFCKVGSHRSGEWLTCDGPATINPSHPHGPESPTQQLNTSGYSNLDSYLGHHCQVVSDCQWLGVGKKVFQDHLQKKHRIDSGTGWAPHRQVILQCLFARSISPAYFVVGNKGPTMTEMAPRDTGDKRERGDLSTDDSCEEPGSKRMRGMKRELNNETLQQTRHNPALARSSVTSYAAIDMFSPARSSGNAQTVKHYFSPAKSSASSHAVTASTDASSSSPSPTAHPISPLAKKKCFANTIFRAEQQDTDVVDNIHACIASDLIEPSKGISESKMATKDVNFSLYRSILRGAGLLNDQICLICYVDSKGQRRGVYTQSMFVAAVEDQINQAEAADMINSHGCASLFPMTAEKDLPLRPALIGGGQMD